MNIFRFSALLCALSQPLFSPPALAFVQERSALLSDLLVPPSLPVARKTETSLSCAGGEAEKAATLKMHAVDNALRTSVAKAIVRDAVLQVENDRLQQHMYTLLRQQQQQMDALQRQLQAARHRYRKTAQEPGADEPIRHTLLLAENNQLKQLMNGLAGQHDPSGAVPDSGAGSSDELNTAASRRSYTAGALLADEIKARLHENHDLGIDIDGAMMLAGIQDGYHGHLQLDKETRQKISDEMDETVKTALSERAEEAHAMLDKAVAGKSILSQQEGVVVVLEKAGSGKYQPGDTVVFDSTESTLSGKIIVNNYNQRVNDTRKLPPVLSGAIEGGKKGGIVALYGFARNIYTPASLPAGVSGDTPVKVTFTLH